MGVHVRWCSLLLTAALLAALAAPASAAEPTLMAAFFVKGKVGLKWQLVDGVSEYHVYRKSQGSEFEKILTTGDDHIFDESVSPGTNYAYKIAIVQKGAELFSSEKSVTIPAQVGEFKAPIWSGLRLDGERIMLKWDSVPGAMAYNIWRSAISGEHYEVVGNAQGSRFVDRNNLVKGQTYFYTISAMNAEFEETERSEERSIKFGVSLEEQQALEKAQTTAILEPVSLSILFELTDAGPNGPMNQPADVFVNSQGMIYVTDALNAKVHCYDSNGSYRFSWGERIPGRNPIERPPGGFVLPFTLFIDSHDRVYVSDIDRHDIQVFDEKGKYLKVIEVDTGSGKNPLRPNGIHVLDDGRIVMTDTGNHRILITDPDGTILQEIGSRGDGNGEFNFPDELTVTSTNQICVVDVINCRVQVLDIEGTFIRAFGSVGQSAGTFARPKGICQDESGRLWISDSMAGMIQSFTTEGEVKSAVGTTEDEWQFASPRGMYMKGGRIYLVSRLQNRVVVFEKG